MISVYFEGSTVKVPDCRSGRIVCFPRHAGTQDGQSDVPRITQPVPLINEASAIGHMRFNECSVIVLFNPHKAYLYDGSMLFALMKF